LSLPNLNFTEFLFISDTVLRTVLLS